MSQPPSAPPTPGVVPRDLRQAGPTELAIDWSDGHASVYPVAVIRRACKCAYCVDEWSGEPLLDPASVPEDVKPTKIDWVGRYALSIHWTDGHSTGIYTFAALRKLCPCDECRGASG